MMNLIFWGFRYPLIGTEFLYGKSDIVTFLFFWINLISFFLFSANWVHLLFYHIYFLSSTKTIRPPLKSHFTLSNSPKMSKISHPISQEVDFLFDCTQKAEKLAKERHFCNMESVAIFQIDEA